MINKSSKNKKASNNTKQQKFIQAAKKGKYGPVETSSIAYVRMSSQAQPLEQTQDNNLYYGVR